MRPTVNTLVPTFRFKQYNILTEEYVVSNRLATVQAIRRIGAEAIGLPVEVPCSALDFDGFTEVGYVPPEERLHNMAPLRQR